MTFYTHFVCWSLSREKGKGRIVTRSYVQRVSDALVREDFMVLDSSIFNGMYSVSCLERGELRSYVPIVLKEATDFLDRLSRRFDPVRWNGSHRRVSKTHGLIAVEPPGLADLCDGRIEGCFAVIAVGNVLNRTFIDREELFGVSMDGDFLLWEGPVQPRENARREFALTTANMKTFRQSVENVINAEALFARPRAVRAASGKMFAGSGKALSHMSLDVPAADPLQRSWGDVGVQDLADDRIVEMPGVSEDYLGLRGRRHG